MLRAIALAALAAGAAAQAFECARGAWVVPLPYGAPVNASFQPYTAPSLAEALAGPPGAIAWRVLAGLTTGGTPDRLVATTTPSAFTWSAVITDGDRATANFGGVDTSIALSAETRYELVVDILGQGNATPAFLSLAGGSAQWDACPKAPNTPLQIADVAPECALEPVVAPARDLTPQIVLEQDVLLSVRGPPDTYVVGMSVLGVGDVRVDAPGTTGQWQAVAVGRANATATFAHPVRVPATGEVTFRITAYGDGAPGVFVQGDTQGVQTYDDRAYAWQGVDATARTATPFVSVTSVFSCANFTTQLAGRSALVVTRNTGASVITVPGWDPDTIAFAGVNLYVSPSAYTKTLVGNVFKNLLAIPDDVRATQTFKITNLMFPLYTVNSVAQIRTAVANAIKPFDSSFSVNDTVLATLIDVYPDPTTVPPPVDVSVVTVSVATGISIANVADLSGSGAGEGAGIKQYLERSGALFTVGAKDVITQAEASQRQSVLFYALPNTNFTLFSSLIKEQVRTFMASTDSPGTIASYGQPWQMNGGGTYEPPPLSSRTAYTLAAVSAAWLLVLAVVSLFNNGTINMGSA